MNMYYINTNAQSNGDHEIHKSDCIWMPDVQHRLYLGMFSSDNEALQEGKKLYKTADGCAYCCKSINHS